MALGPKDVDRKAIIAQAEYAIDDAIKSSGRTPVTISTRLLGRGFGSEDWVILRARYIKAGWKSAEWKNDPRDGDYIELIS